MNSTILVDATGRVLLYPTDQSSRKVVGLLVEKTLIVQKSENHLFYSTNSYGFNYQAIQEIHFETLRVECSDGTILETTKKFILAKGVIDTFQPHETQIFLPLEEFGLQRARKFEAAEEKRKRMNPTMWDCLGIERPRGGKQ